MAEFLALLVIVIVPLVAAGLAALRWGVDSRDRSTDPRAPARPTGIV